MRFFIVDDDENVIHILSLIIENRYLGKVVGSASNGKEALDEMKECLPDIVIVDLLMPMMDGITFVKKARQMGFRCGFIMLSQVSSKEMVASAYESGVEFFIQKPINSIEVEKVIKTVSQNMSFKKALSHMENDAPSEEPAIKSGTNAKRVLEKIGIIGENGARDILSLVTYISKNKKDCENLSLNTLCSRLSDSPKSLEQRVRRAAFSGLVNLANLGVEDYGNEIFTEYACSLYGFEQVRKEMDFLRGKSKTHGKVQMKMFLNALSFLDETQEG